MIITIPEPTCSLNELIRKFRNEHARAAERNRWHYLVREQVGPPKGNALDACEITVTRHGGKMLDWDNFGGGCKFLLDALRSNGVIVDDKPSVVKRLNLDQHIDRKNGRTVVEIIPVK